MADNVHLDLHDLSCMSEHRPHREPSPTVSMEYLADTGLDCVLAPERVVAIALHQLEDPE